MNSRVEIAEKLLDIKAVSIVGKDNLFTWASGIKSPIYCDNRMTMSYPLVRKLIANTFVAYIKQHYPQVDVIAGTATAGIPHAAWVADLMDLPMVYIRSSAKGHGKGNQIEGRVKAGQKVLIIEDLISTGGSALKAVHALLESEAEVLAVGAIFTYNFDEADQAFKDEKIPYFTLTDYQTLLPVAKHKGYIQEQDYHELKVWSKNPRVFTV